MPLRPSDDLSLLQHLAEAATPGEWSVAGLSASPDRVLGPFSVDRIADAEFIAAANPTVVLGLIERVRKAEALLDAVIDFVADIDRDSMEPMNEWIYKSLATIILGPDPILSTEEATE